MLTESNPRVIALTGIAGVGVWLSFDATSFLQPVRKTTDRQKATRIDLHGVLTTKPTRLHHRSVG